jgi:hypothetical protein
MGSFREQSKFPRFHVLIILESLHAIKWYGALVDPFPLRFLVNRDIVTNFKAQYCACVLIVYHEMKFSYTGAKLWVRLIFWK